LLAPEQKAWRSLYGDAASVALLFATETDLSPSTAHMLVLRCAALLGSLPSDPSRFRELAQAERSMVPKRALHHLYGFEP
jgi:hypothetical protein